MEDSKYISSFLNKYSIYHDAPELLSEQMMELQKILINFKAKNGENDTYKKFTEVLNAMRHSFNFMNDIAFVYKENHFLKNQITIYTELLRMNDGELSKYKAIEASMLDGTIEEKINVVKRKIENND
jgi:hypothetical protein